MTVNLQARLAKVQTLKEVAMMEKVLQLSTVCPGTDRLIVK